MLSFASVIGAFLTVGPIGSVPLPGTSSVTVPLSPPIACGRCHRPEDEADLDGIYDTWTGSVMGHAARDPVFLAALTVAEDDAPGVGDFCLRCHAPEAWLQGRCFPTGGELLEPSDSGVTCSICHRMEETPFVKNAQYIVADDSVMRGPYEKSVAPHQNARADWISDARLCGTCHDLFNPLVHRLTLTGTPTGALFPEQTTYSEWLASAFFREGRDCKQCHMPEVSGQVADIGPVRPDRSDHGIAGANTFLLDAIDFLYPELDLSVQLARGRARNEAMLRDAATLEVLAAPTSITRGAPFSISLRLTNETGHKLPTGYPEGRRAFVVARTSTDAAVLDASGEIIDPLAVYEVVHGQLGIGQAHHLALNDVVMSDTRIPPRGMIVTSTIAPVGKTYPEIAPGVLAHWDDLVYQGIAPCDDDDEVAVQITLYYQVLSKGYADFLVAANAGQTRGDQLRAAFEAIDPQPLIMAQTTIRLPIDPGSRCVVPDAGFAEPDAAVLDAESAADAATVADAGVTPDAGPDILEGGCACTTSARTGLMPDGPGLVSLIILLGWRARRKR